MTDKDFEQIRDTITREIDEDCSERKAAAINNKNILKVCLRVLQEYEKIKED